MTVLGPAMCTLTTLGGDRPASRKTRLRFALGEVAFGPDLSNEPGALADVLVQRIVSFRVASIGAS